MDKTFKVKDVFENSPSMKGWQPKVDGVVKMINTPDPSVRGELNRKYYYLPIDTVSLHKSFFYPDTLSTFK